MSLISFKRKLFYSPSSFLYDSDDAAYHFEKSTNDYDANSVVVKSGGGVACDFILTRFQDYVLYRLTDHVINQSGCISADRIANASSVNANSLVETVEYMTTASVNSGGEKNSSSSKDEEQKEVADSDELEFESIKEIYRLNLDYFGESDRLTTTVQQDTQFILLEFLNMLNSWKLRKFDY